MEKSQFQITFKIGAVLFAALFLRLLFFSIIAQHPERTHFGDWNQYDNLAQNLLKNSHFYRTFDGITPIPETSRTIGYPLYLSAIYSIVGHKKEIVALTQNFLDILSVLLIFLILNNLITPRTSLIGALLYAVDPVPHMFVQFLTPETLFIFLILAGVLASVISHKTNSIKIFLISAVSWGIAAHIRPMGTWLIFLLCAQVIFLGRQNHLKWQVVIYHAIKVSSMFILILLPWIIRNYILFGTLFFSNISNLAYIQLHVIPALARAEKRTPEEMKIQFYKDALEKHPELKHIGERFYYTDPAVAKKFFNAGISSVLMHKKIYFIGLTENFIRTMLIPGTARSEYLRTIFGLSAPSFSALREEIRQFIAQKKWGQAIRHFYMSRVGWLTPAAQLWWWYIFIFEFIISLLASLSILILFRSEQSFFFKLFILINYLIIVYFISSPGLEVDLRYRFPVEPIFCILAAITLNNLPKILTRDPRKNN